jgi:glyoxylase-like metal-dependent hydrolase (beta-lactamase superfamily II)
MTAFLRAAFGTVLASLACCIAQGEVLSAPVPGSAHDLVQLAPGVCAIVRHVEAGSADGNTLFIINDSDVVVVDTGGYAADAREAIAEIRKRTDKPVRYIINTHHHADHTLGNQLLLDTFPGAEIIGHARTRDLTLSDGAIEPSAFQKEIAGIDRELAAGKTSDGEVLTPEHRRHLELAKASFEFWIRDNRGAKRLPPTLTVAEDLVLHRGERTIQVRFFGEGHTPGDAVVYLPKERILAAGDLVVHPVPFGGATNLRAWPQTLRAMRRLEVAAIVPGHGDIQRDWSYVDRQIALFESTWAQVKRAVDSGANLTAVRKAVDGDALAKAFGITSTKDREEFDYTYLDPAVTTAFQTLRPTPTVGVAGLN